ncbi:MAG: type II toxin-antitoxin system RelE/ParE family toxin [Magnetococcales bacterium]|nr:type II toxin-antitoxin system RelE/ParE family toxin [Magnetococcales bacterium]
MSKTIKYRARGRQDLLEIWEYIAKDSMIHAQAWTQRINAILTSLAAFPDLGRLRPEFDVDIRSYPVGNYLILYKEIPNGVLVVRVFHGKRHLQNAWNT